MQNMTDLYTKALIFLGEPASSYAGGQNLIFVKATPEEE